MIDNKARLFGKVSIIDIIIVLAILALGVGFAVRETSPGLGGILNPDTPFYVTISGDGLRHFIVDAVSVGDVMFRHHGRHPLGTVVDIDIQPAMDYLHRLDGTAVLVETEQRYKIYITLASTGSIRDIGYLVNGTDHIAPGSEVALISNRAFIPDGRVHSITRP